MSPIDQAIEATARPPLTARVSSLCGVEYALALLLFAAASLKTSQLLNGSEIAIPIFLGHKAAFAALIQAELLLALWLLVGGASRLRFVCAIVCFYLFACVASYEFFHAVASCGCFGKVKVPPGITAAFDIAAVVALWLARDRHATWKIDLPSPPRLAGGLSAAGILTAALWTGFFLAPTDSAAPDLVVLDPSSWPNRPFPLFDEIDGSTPLHTGRWLVVLYHFDCSDCLAAIPAYQSLAKQVHVAFVAMPPFGQSPPADSPDYLRFILRPDREWFATTPVVAALQDGNVMSVAAGDKAVHPPDLELLFSPPPAR
jgi:hypothetical protein